MAVIVSVCDIEGLPFRGLSPSSEPNWVDPSMFQTIGYASVPQPEINRGRHGSSAEMRYRSRVRQNRRQLEAQFRASSARFGGG
jgi:hypothetical protein